MPRNQALATKILTVENAFETTWSGDDQLKTQQGQERMLARRMSWISQATSKYKATAPS